MILFYRIDILQAVKSQQAVASHSRFPPLSCTLSTYLIPQICSNIQTYRQQKLGDAFLDLWSTEEGQVS